MYLVYVEQAVHGSLSVHLEIGTFYLFFFWKPLLLTDDMVYWLFCMHVSA